MQRVLITAFEPYDRWTENASWLALVELTRQMPTDVDITTRRYPVDYDEVTLRLTDDLVHDFDYALHLGQAPGTSQIQLEAVGLNVAAEPEGDDHRYRKLVADGPDAYLTRLPLERWASDLQSAGIPTIVSHHAGTYLCNAVLYLSRHIAATRDLKLKSAFIHLPFAPTQALHEPPGTPSMPTEMVADATRLILQNVRQTPEFLA